MEQWIEHLIEPVRLILSWQSPAAAVDRRRWAVGELSRREGKSEFRYFAGDEFRAMNHGRTPSNLRDDGFLGYAAFTWRADQPDQFTAGALEAFLRRVASPTRRDFPAYLQTFRMRPREGLSGFALLGLTGAALPSDGFSLVDPLDPDVPAQDVLLEVTGHHYHAHPSRRLTVGTRLNLVAEPDNAADSSAVQVHAAGAVVGYVNRLQSASVSRWLVSRSVSAWVSRVNGSEERPKAYMMLQVRELARVLAD